MFIYWLPYVAAVGGVVFAGGSSARGGVGGSGSGLSVRPFGFL